MNMKIGLAMKAGSPRLVLQLQKKYDKLSIMLDVEQAKELRRMVEKFLTENENVALS